MVTPWNSQHTKRPFHSCLFNSISHWACSKYIQTLTGLVSHEEWCCLGLPGAGCIEVAGTHLELCTTALNTTDSPVYWALGDLLGEQLSHFTQRWLRQFPCAIRTALSEPSGGAVLYKQKMIIAVPNFWKSSSDGQVAALMLRSSPGRQNCFSFLEKKCLSASPPHSILIVLWFSIYIATASKAFQGTLQTQTCMLALSAFYRWRSWLTGEMTCPRPHTANQWQNEEPSSHDSFV